MRTKVLFNEGKRFLKENNRKILLFTLLGAIIFAIFTATNLILDDEDSGLETEQTEEKNNVAEFTIYIEKEDETYFNNNVLLEAMLFSEDAIKVAEKATNVEISELLLEQKNSDFVLTDTDRGIIGVVRDLSNETMVFQFKLENRSDSLKVANYYFDRITNNEIKFLEDKEIFVLSTPEIQELSQAENSLLEENENSVSPLLLIIKLLVSLFVGAVLGVVVSIFYHIFNKKINYAFNYHIGENEIFLVERENQDKLVYDIINPKSEEKIVVTEHTLPSDLLNTLSNSNSKISVTKNIVEVNTNVNIPEIVFLIVENETTKKWYDIQREYLKRFDSNIKIIQVNKKIFNTK
ncbi:hypothetical protein [Marinilactibacillus psychrotolerans]|uniref:hypothetical protein n=1 Tax=Marinilactibacillus psychrotolerans TaxID=191770 RepID=UPI0038854F2D